MAGLLDYNVDPIAQGLLGFSQGMLTPRAQGGGVAAALGGFNQGALSAQELIRKRQSDALRERMMLDQADMQKQRFGMDQQKFGMERQQFDDQRAAQAAQIQKMTAVRQHIERAKPDLLPLFDANPVEAMKRLFPEPDKPQVVGPGAALVQNGQPIFTNPKEAEPTAIEKALSAAGIDPKSPQGQSLLQQYAIKTATHQPAANIQQINAGQKGLDNEFKLRGEFQGLPTTKAFGEVRGAYDIIKSALANPSGANDLAAATKFMKLLDPGSVVRESELGMAMAATGMADRMQNYVQMMASGQKLTPKQRQDFAAAADQIYNAARKTYNESAKNIRTQASKWELDPEAVAPAPWKTYGYKTKAEAVNDARNAIMKNPAAKDEIVRRLAEDMDIPDHGIK